MLAGRSEFEVTDRMVATGWSDDDIDGILRSLSAATTDELVRSLHL